MNTGRSARPEFADDATAAVTVRSLRVERGGALVLPGISLDVPAGAITGLLGPSGSGKTTMMRAIMGIQVIAGGAVTVLGKPAGDPALRRRIGYVTQAPSVYSDLSVRENVDYFARIALGRGPSPRQVAGEVLERVGLADRGNQLVGTLSGGQRSRVSLACALLGHPDLLVLDEPTVGLDPVLRASLWELFRQLAGSGCSLLISSHVMDEANHCDQLLLLRAGELVFHGPPNALLERTGAASADEAFLQIASTGREGDE